jgi:hypothetical protein
MMRISEGMHASFAQTSSGPGKAVPPNRTAGNDEVLELSIPLVADLTESQQPARQALLDGLAESVRSGRYSCSPDQVATAILTRGLEGQ